MNTRCTFSRKWAAWRLLFAIFLGLIGFNQIASAMSCKAAVGTKLMALKESRAKMFSRDRGPKIERRIKILTTGRRQDASPDMDPGDFNIDSADPSLIMPIIYPDGTKKYRINFSAMRYIEADSITSFFHGGVFKVRRTRGFYADGTEMVGPYHLSSWPWDVVIYKNKDGKNIALGGVMKQPAPGTLPNVAEHNKSRSRWWGDVRYVKNWKGEYEEHIIWQGPVHDFNQNPLSPDSWIYHGYGGTLLTQFNPVTGEHELVKNKNGNYVLFYERVTEEKANAHGIMLPWVTTMFSREMDPSLTHTVGPEVQVTNLINPRTGNYYKSTKRGTETVHDGYLGEGGNVLIEKRFNMPIKAWSANDYVRKYGIYLDYRPANSDPMGMYKPVVDKNGELIDFASKLDLRKIMNATWVGRPQLIYDPQGNLWLLFHFVPIESIPKGGPVEGWPSAEHFVKYGRITAMAPVAIKLVGGQPHLILDVRK